MKIASITETKNRLSALLDEVRQGETILVTDRGRPVARITAATQGGRTTEETGLVDRLERAGLVLRGERDAAPPLSGPPRRRRGRRFSALRALLDEREAGR